MKDLGQQRTSHRNMGKLVGGERGEGREDGERGEGREER